MTTRSTKRTNSIFRRELATAKHAKLRELGLSPEEIDRALDPMRSFHLQFAEEVAYYERLKRGEVDDLTELAGLGPTLIGLRIACGLTQRELAARLGIHETQVSRDERNEYHGITVERAGKILKALGVEVRVSFECPPNSSAQPSSDIRPSITS